jgi:hypothetical protein
MQDRDPIERELCQITLFKEKYKHARKHCLITFQRQTPQVKQEGPSTFAIYEAEPHQADRICKASPNQAPVVHRVTIRPNTLVTVPSGCIMVTGTFTFSPVATSFRQEGLPHRLRLARVIQVNHRGIGHLRTCKDTERNGRTDPNG